jgi:hypothetical protein
MSVFGHGSEVLRLRPGTVAGSVDYPAFFFDDTKLSDKRPLNVHDLDEVSSEHPVLVRHRGGHTYFYNSRAFQMAGITKDTANPTGHLRQGCQRQLERTRHRSGVGAVQPGRHQAHLLGRGKRNTRA